MARDEYKEIVFTAKGMNSIIHTEPHFVDTLWISRKCVSKLIDEIWDDFESRTCESCNYSNKMYNINKDHVAYDCSVGHLEDMFSLPIDFCCNKWEAKNAK